MDVPNSSQDQLKLNELGIKIELVVGARNRDTARHLQSLNEFGFFC